MRGKLSKREYAAKMAGKPMPYANRKMQLEALKKKVPVYKSGMMNGKPIDFMSKKTKRGTITSID